MIRHDELWREFNQLRARRRCPMRSNGRKHRSNAPKAKTLAIRTQVDGADFGGNGKGGDGAGVIEPQTFSGGADRGGDQTGGACSAVRQKASRGKGLSR